MFPIVWAAFTYYHQQIQQRRQDFLRAYDIVHGDLGKGITNSIDKAIKPLYDSPDVELAAARQRADVAATPADRAAALAEIQTGLVNNRCCRDLCWKLMGRSPVG